MRFSHCRYAWDGLNSLKYKLLGVESKHLYTHIRASINEKEVMSSVPGFKWKDRPTTTANPKSTTKPEIDSNILPAGEQPSKVVVALQELRTGS